ncbi:hypothetical protein ACSSS7_006780 [Eimeria intestinalis]
MEPLRSLLVFVAFACLLTSASWGVLQGGALLVAAGPEASSEGSSTQGAASAQREVRQQHGGKLLAYRIVTSLGRPRFEADSLHPPEGLYAEAGGQLIAEEKLVAQGPLFLIGRVNPVSPAEGFPVAHGDPRIVKGEDSSSFGQEEVLAIPASARNTENADEGFDPDVGAAKGGDEDGGAGRGRGRASGLAACWWALGALQDELLSLFVFRNPHTASGRARATASDAGGTAAADKDFFFGTKTTTVSEEEDPRRARAGRFEDLMRTCAEHAVAALSSSLWPRAKEGVSPHSGKRDTLERDEDISLLLSRQQSQGASSALAVGQKWLSPPASKGDSSLMQQQQQQEAIIEGESPLLRRSDRCGSSGRGHDADAVTPGSVEASSKPLRRRETGLQSGSVGTGYGEGQRETRQQKGSNGEGGETEGEGDLNEETVGRGLLVDLNLGLIGVAAGLLLLLLVVLVGLGSLCACKKSGARESGRGEKGDVDALGRAAGNGGRAAPAQTHHSLSPSPSNTSAHGHNAFKGGGQLHHPTLVPMAFSRKPGNGVSLLQKGVVLSSAKNVEGKGAQTYARRLGRSFSTEIQSVSKQQQQQQQRASCLVAPAAYFACRPMQIQQSGPMNQLAAAQRESFALPVLQQHVQQQQLQQGQAQQQQQLHSEWRSRRLQEYKSLEAEVERELAAQRGWEQQDLQGSNASTSSSFSSSSSSSSGNELQDERQRGLSLLGHINSNGSSNSNSTSSSSSNTSSNSNSSSSRAATTAAAATGAATAIGAAAASGSAKEF